MAIFPIPKLYKHISNERLIRLLEKPSICFTQLDALNDPHECPLTLSPEALLEDHKEWRVEAIPGIDYSRRDDPLSEAEQTFVENALLRCREHRQNLGEVSLTDDPIQLLMR